MKKLIIAQAVKTARMKIKHHPEYEKGFIHYSFIIQDNKVLGYATNGKYEMPCHFGYNKRQNNREFKAKLHSEIWGWRKVKGILNKYEKFEILNLRFSKQGFLRLSRPCSVCYEVLGCLGCKRFIYSTNIENSFLEQKV